MSNESESSGLTVVMCDCPDHAPNGPLGKRTDADICHGCHVAVHCNIHEEYFVIRAFYHIGDNEEKVAYGCPRCDRERWSAIPE